MKRAQGSSWWFEQARKHYDKMNPREAEERKWKALVCEIYAKLKAAKVSERALVEHYKGTGAVPGWAVDVTGMVAGAPEFSEQLLRSWDSSIRPLLPREPETEQ